MTRAVRPRDDVGDDEETQQLFQADVDDEDEEEDVPDGHDARQRTIGLENAHVNKIDIPIPSSPPFMAQSEGHAMTSGSATRSADDLSGQAGAILVRVLFFLFEPSHSLDP